MKHKEYHTFNYFTLLLSNKFLKKIMEFLKAFFSGFCSSKTNQNTEKKHISRRFSDDVPNERIIQIMQQLEFYLSGPNLRTNKKLSACVRSNPDRFAPLDMLLEYNKMKAIQPTQHEINSAVLYSKKLEFNNDKTMIRTISAENPNDPTYVKRSVKFSGFDESETEERIRELIFSRFGKYERLSILHKIKDMQHTFNGCVIVVFETIEQAVEAAKGFEYEGKQISCERMETMRQTIHTNKKLRKNRQP